MKNTEEDLSNQGTTETPGKNPKETDISNLPGKEFKETVKRILTKPESRIEERKGNSTKRKHNKSQAYHTAIKIMKSCHCDNLDGLRGYYAK